MTTITLQLSPELEQKLRESIARHDSQSIRQLLADAFAPTVEVLLGQILTQFNDRNSNVLSSTPFQWSEPYLLPLLSTAGEAIPKSTPMTSSVAVV
jgi:hypothetical protein